MKIVALDLSLTSTGAAQYEDGAVRTLHFGDTGKRDATLLQRHGRLEEARWQAVSACVHDVEPDLVLIEAHTFAAKGGSQHDRSGLWWLVVHTLIHEHDIPVAEVSPTQVKQYITGKGNAPKDAVLMNAVRRFPDVEFETNDEADALGMLAMGARYLGVSQGIDRFETEPTSLMLKAMTKVRWPL